MSYLVQFYIIICQNNKRNDEIYMVYEHENKIANDIDQPMTQNNNVGSSSRHMIEKDKFNMRKLFLLCEMIILKTSTLQLCSIFLFNYT